jgi:fucose 4-O-acetylase-like acetyltransferase
MKESRSLSLDFTRGIAIILVVWAHADTEVMDPSFYAENLKLIHQIIYSVHMSLWFILTGTLLKRSIEFSQINFPTLLKKLTNGLLIPFYSLGLIFLLIRLVAPKSLLNYYNFGDMIKALLIYQFDIQKLPSGVLWYLFAIFIFSILIYVLIEIFKINDYIVLLMAFFLKLFHGYLPELKIFGLITVPLFFIFFAVGYVKWQWVMEPKINKPFFWFPILFLIWLLFFLYKPLYPSLSQIICGISASLLLLGLSQKINHSQDNPVLKIFYWCGCNSVLIFVLHTAFFVFIKKILELLNLRASFAGFGIAVIGGVVLPLILGKMMSRFRFYPVLFGRPFISLK